jgi:predicted nucleotidyltransferase
MPKLGSNIPNMGMRAAATLSSKANAPPPARVSLASALFSSTQQRVLGLLFGQPERSFFATELIGLVGAGSGAVQRELQRLADSGLVTVKRIGNQKHFQANHSAPIFTELRDIVVKTIGPAEVLRTALLPVADRIHLALLYGSVPKGSDHAGSDIDLLVVSDKVNLEEVYAALASAETQVGRPVNLTLYTEREFRSRRAKGNPFLATVLAGESIVLIGGKDAVGYTR